MDIKKLPVTSEKRIQAAQQKNADLFFEIGVRTLFDFMAVQSMDAPLMVHIILRTKGNVKENRRQFRGKFTERKRNISDLIHEIFTKLYIQSQSRL